MPTQKAQKPLGTMEQPREAPSRQTGVEEEMGFAGTVRLIFLKVFCKKEVPHKKPRFYMLSILNVGIPKTVEKHMRAKTELTSVFPENSNFSFFRKFELQLIYCNALTQ
jgi:hypothetical protein